MDLPTPFFCPSTAYPGHWVTYTPSAGWGIAVVNDQGDLVNVDNPSLRGAQ